MEDSQQTRVLTAALFAGRSLLVQLLMFRRGLATRLHLRVCPKQQDDPIVALWRYGNRQSYPPVAAVWPHQHVDPWQEVSYLGQLPAVSQIGSGGSCRLCGAARTSGTSYCGRCGSSLDSDERLFALRVARIAGDLAAGSPNAGAGVVTLLDECTKTSAHFENGRAELLQFIEADFNDSAEAEFISCEPAPITPGLTLASAEGIHQSVTATGRVLPEQIQQAELLLKYAPLHFGYWGPFKALVKSVPVEDTPDAYADALARLSSADWTMTAPTSVQIEDTSFLSAFFDIPSPKTLAYLARRVRRDLAGLAKRSPEVYAQVAVRMILSWDQSLCRNAFAPAYVMLGGRGPLDGGSRRVLLTPDMSSRRDAHPEIWNDRPELVQHVFDNVKHSVESHTWSFQVLEALGTPPAITASNLKLALSSTYAPLNLLARSALPSRPGSWGLPTTEQWAAMFRDADDENIDGILDAMAARNPRPAAVEAARQFLISDLPRTPARQFHVSLMFLAATQLTKKQRLVVDADADVAAVISLLCLSATEHEKLWSPILRGFKLNQLQRVREALPSDAQYEPVRSLVDDLLLSQRAKQASPDDAIDWIASANATEAELGWQLIASGYGIKGLLERLPRWIARRLPDPTSVERVITELLPRLVLDDSRQLAQVVQEALARGVPPSDLVQLLTDSPVGRAALWQELLDESGSGLAQVIQSIPDATRVIGDDVSADQLGHAAPTQLQFVLRYIVENPGRIASDAAFGVAAALSAERGLQVDAISQLRANGHLLECWVTLAESLVPNAVAAAMDYVRSLSDPIQFRDAVLRCMNGGAAAVRDAGARMLYERLRQSDDRLLWFTLAESNDSRLKKAVATEALASSRVDERALTEFDYRVLVDHDTNRGVKELVKARLEKMHAGSGLDSQERVAALVKMARCETLLDREWALQKLTELALAGRTVEGLDVSLVPDAAS